MSSLVRHLHRNTRGRNMVSAVFSSSSFSWFQRRTTMMPTATACRIQSPGSRGTRRGMMTTAAETLCAKDIPETVKTAAALPPTWYHDAEYHEKEREHYLKHQWHCVGHESLLQEGTSFLVEDVAGYSVILVRDGRENVIRGFHNACRHRGGPLEWTETRGKCPLNGLRCKYHGWVYNTEGDLKSTPSFGDAEGFDKRDWPLYQVRVANWRGYLFVRIETEGRSTEDCVETIDRHSASSGGGSTDANSFTQTHAAFIKYMKGHQLERFTQPVERKHVLECNWKVYVENYAEGYHIPLMHPLLNEQVDMKEYKVHCNDGYMLHNTPIDPDSAAGGVWIYLVPTVAFNMYENCMLVERVVPITPTQCEIRYCFLFDKEATAANIEDTMAFSKLVTMEDVQICEAVQKNLEQGVYEAGRLSPRHEQGVHYFQSLVEQAMRAHI